MQNQRFTTLRISDGQIVEGVATQETVATIRVPVPDWMWEQYESGRDPTEEERRKMFEWMQPYLEEWHVGGQQ